MKLKHETIEQRVDTSTGEVVNVTTQKTFTIKTTTDTFYMTFIKHTKSIFKLKSAVDIKLIIKLCELAEYNTGRVILPSPLRKDVCVDLEITTQQFSNAISSLKKKKLITGAQGLYNINPLIFWKGTTDNRVNLLKEIEVSYKIK